MSRGVNRLDPHGTPADKSDDVWGAYVTNDWLPSPDVTAVRVEPDVTWIGTSGGLVAYREDARTTFDLGSATALERDAAGVLWIATSVGLAALSDGGTPFDQSDDILTKYSKADGLVASAVRGLAIDAAGRVWCATSDGVSVLDPAGTPHDKTDDRWATFTVADGMAGDWANAIAVEGDRLVWIVHESASVSVLDCGGTPFDKADDVWATYGESAPIGKRSGYSVTVDESGLKWFGLCDGVWAFDDGGSPLVGADDRWLRFDIGDCNPGIAIDDAGRKWVATGWSGITMLDDGGTPFDTSDDVVANYTLAEGLIDDRTQAIAVGAGVIWIGTNGGLSRLTP
jgi:ligand-binding sensor domain-containing protein